MKLRKSVVTFIVLLATCHNQNTCFLTEGTVLYNHYLETYKLNVAEQKAPAPPKLAVCQSTVQGAFCSSYGKAYNTVLSNRCPFFIKFMMVK